MFGLTAAPAMAATTYYTTTGLTLGIDDNGKVVNFTDLVTGVERATQIATYQQPFCQVSYAGQVVNPTACAKLNGLLVYTFGTLPLLPTVSIRIVPKSTYLEVTLEAATSTGQLDFIRFINVSALGSIDGALYRYLSYNDSGHGRYACVTPIDVWTMTNVLPSGGGNYLWANAYPNLTNPVPVLMTGRKAALFTCEATQAGFFSAMQTIDTAYGIPIGVSGKQYPNLNKSQVFWMGGNGGFNYADRDEVLQYTLNMGASKMLVHDMLWGDQWNAWVPNPMWGGAANLKAWVDQCKAAGLYVGAHLLIGTIPKKSVSYISAGADPRLARDRTATLAVSISAGLVDGLIQTTTAPTDWPTNTGDRDLVIDTEIIQYTSLKTDAPPYGFQGPFARAKNQPLLGARPHNAGASVQRLINSNADWGYYWDCGPSNGIGQNAADMAATLNQVGFDFIYGDELIEQHMNLGPGGYGNDMQMETVINALAPRPKWAEASNDMGGFSWSYIGVDGQMDFTYIDQNGLKGEVDRNISMMNGKTKYNTYLPLQIGWARLFNPMSSYVTTLDDIEYIYAKSIAWDRPVTLQVWFPTFKSAPNRDAIFSMMQKYENLRQTSYFNSATKTSAQQPGRDFMLFTENGVHSLVPVSLLQIAGGNPALRGFLTDSTINGYRYATIWPTDVVGHKLILSGVSTSQVVVKDYNGIELELPQSSQGALAIPVNSRIYIKLVGVANITNLFNTGFVQ